MIIGNWVLSLSDPAQARFVIGVDMPDLQFECPWPSLLVWISRLFPKRGPCLIFWCLILGNDAFVVNRTTMASYLGRHRQRAYQLWIILAVGVTSVWFVFMDSPKIGSRTHKGSLRSAEGYVDCCRFILGPFPCWNTFHFVRVYLRLFLISDNVCDSYTCWTSRIPCIRCFQ